MINNLIEKFNQVKMEQSSFISEADNRFGQETENEFNLFVCNVKKYILYISENPVENQFFSSNKTVESLEEKLSKESEGFINKIAGYFETNYNIRLNTEEIKKPFMTKRDDYYRKFFTYEISFLAVLSEIIKQLDGFNLVEKGLIETKKKLNDAIYRVENIELRKNKVTLLHFAAFDYSWDGLECSINNYCHEKMIVLARALNHFDTGRNCVSADMEFFASWHKEPLSFWLNEITFPYKNKLQSLRFYKNRKLDIKFKTSEMAFEFMKEYCGFIPQENQRIA